MNAINMFKERVAFPAVVLGMVQGMMNSRDG